MQYGYAQLRTWTFYFLSLAAQVRRARARRHTCTSWGSNTYANAAFAAMWVMQMVGDKSRVLSMNVQNKGEIGLSFGYYANATGNTKFTSAEAEMRAAIENGMRGVNVAALQQQKLGALHTLIELLFGVDAFRIHNDAVALSTRSDGSRDWAGYAGYSWQQTKFNDWTAGYGSLGSYRTQGRAAMAEEAIEAEYTFTRTASRHLNEVVKRGENAGQLARPYMRSPLTIQEIISTGRGIPDASFKGGMNWKVPGTFRGSQGIWELGMNPKTNTIYHFNFTN